MLKQIALRVHFLETSRDEAAAQVSDKIKAIFTRKI